MTINNPLSAAANQLFLAQGMTEDQPQIYSDKTWGLLADAMDLVNQALELGTYEENTPPDLR
ncbi:MAG: hypothetical protein CL959_01800 [Euryarchaeota archaeon]|nr:hypothetical protein [Euryarchaeota archaeon]|tara:strand:- start:762 stop:947 length:186 start_codon:yes stop_codon:yes gene_type:complete